ncbi:HAMP domain-containing histidine kinase [Adhaeribacter swui]|uniref:histidine kinase n=1 Tax=Adhaeribacter swui TaxID=2086471 RepID=A0A7G7GC58_9BACT|nr:HAMP domain-containing sensor histidine kinase [Adhaeribacter swui]QNF34742.1 HAMP domain-containing histidine kinase [Adhaeribacter swui]
MEATKIALQNRLQLLSIILAWFALVIAVLSLTGWFFQIESLRSSFGAAGTMKVNTALCILGCSLSIISLRLKRTGITRLLAILVFLICQISILEYFLNQNLGIDQLFYTDVVTDPTLEPPGRMSLLSACNIYIITLALVAFTYQRYGLAQLLVAFFFILTYASFLGHLYGITQFYQFGRFSTIAGHTALALLLLNLSILLYCSESGWMKIFSSPYMGGKLARTSFGYFLLTVPILMGFYLYGLNQWNFTPTSSLVSSFLVICLITLPIAHIFLNRLDKLDAILQKTNSNLKQTNADLAVRNQELTNINQSLDDIVYMASHDLKGPINNLEAIFRELNVLIKSQLPPEDQQLIFFGANSVNNLKKTIQDLTQIIQSQQIDTQEPERIQLVPLLTEIQDELQSEINESAATFYLNLQTEYVFFSRIHLRSIFSNLISNALKYRSPERAPEINISAEPVPGGVQLRIADNGLGLTEVQQAKLFTLFKRFHNHVAGSGIGLYLIKRTIENYGGQIAVTSTINTGTAFTIFLPQQT